MMSTVKLETCTDEINKYMKKCVKLVIARICYMHLFKVPS